MHGEFCKRNHSLETKTCVCDHTNYHNDADLPNRNGLIIIPLVIIYMLNLKMSSCVVSEVNLMHAILPRSFVSSWEKFFVPP